MSVGPGWYHGNMDPEGTERWFNGERWVGDARPVVDYLSNKFPGGERSPIEWMTLPYKRYADFGGRSTRAEYWWFQLLYVGMLVLLGLPGLLLLDTSFEFLGITMLVFCGILFFGSIIPSWAVIIRRLHDTNKSGLWILSTFIPFVGIIGSFAIMLFMFLPGDQGDNRYGRSPYRLKNTDPNALLVD